MRTKRTGLLLLIALFSALCAYGAVACAQEWSTGDVEERQLGERVLTLGSWGADVFALQLHLRDLGFDLQADGMYGEITRDAVRAFQQQNGLPVTGNVGQRTLAAINEALLRQMATMEYTVESGDSLWSIARAFETSMGVLIALNDLPDRPLRVGERIKVPALLVYKVKPGDTLSEVAERFHTTVAAIAELNGIRSDDILSVGQELRMPRDAFQTP